jgi:hypothetical protein
MKSFLLTMKKSFINIFFKSPIQSITKTLRDPTEKQNSFFSKENISSSKNIPNKISDTLKNENIKESKINKYFKNDIKKYDGRLN